MIRKGMGDGASMRAITGPSRDWIQPKAPFAVVPLKLRPIRPCRFHMEGYIHSNGTARYSAARYYGTVRYGTIYTARYCFVATLIIPQSASVGKGTSRPSRYTQGAQHCHGTTTDLQNMHYTIPSCHFGNGVMGLVEFGNGSLGP